MIHREGIKISLYVLVIVILLNSLIFLFTGPSLPAWVILVVSTGFMVFIFRFFRIPKRIPAFTAGRIYAPADGRIVAIEPTEEQEYFKDERIQVSIFMSVWDVHINWFPVEGILTYYRYHPGKYLVARHPKSSILNERNTIVIKTEKGEEILLRQIAGTLARRIISYARKDKTASAGDELGFIRFGSRVDVFLPPDCNILVDVGQKVWGLNSPLAELN